MLHYLLGPRLETRLTLTHDVDVDVDARVLVLDNFTWVNSNSKQGYKLLTRGESSHFFGCFPDLGEILGRKAKKRSSVV